jgi:hypothetical protein
MDVDYSFGNYHSKTEASGQTLHPHLRDQGTERSVSKVDELKKFYRMIQPTSATPQC